MTPPVKPAIPRTAEKRGKTSDSDGAPPISGRGVGGVHRIQSAKKKRKNKKQNQIDKSFSLFLSKQNIS
jgi:hypothetical protein